MFAYAGRAIHGDFGVAFAAIVVSYGFSFGYDYLYRREMDNYTGEDFIVAPFLRIMVLAYTVAGGFFVVMPILLVFWLFGKPELGSQLGWATALVLAKLGIEVAYHLEERKRGVVRLRPLRRGGRLASG